MLCGASGGELGAFVSGCGAANVVALALEGGERGGGVVALWTGPLLCASGMFKLEGAMAPHVRLFHFV